jgi:hypothetical protein
MQGSRETTHKADACGSFRRILPRTPSTLFPLPLIVPLRKKKTADGVHPILLP